MYPAAHLQPAAASLPAGDSELDGQLAHEPLPLLLLYFPAPQLTHAAPSGPVYPASHLQSEEESLAAGDPELAGQSWQLASDTAAVESEYLPLAHAIQDPEPVATLYWPAAHAAQMPPLAPVNPALQMQSVEALLPTGACEPEGQSWQPPSDDAASALEYLPLAQSVHEPGPTALLCFPAGQAAQLPPAGPVYPALHSQSVPCELPVKARHNTQHPANASEIAQVHICYVSSVMCCVCVCRARTRAGELCHQRAWGMGREAQPTTGSATFSATGSATGSATQVAHRPAGEFELPGHDCRLVPPEQ